MKTCCDAGYTYVASLNKCVSLVSAANMMDPVDCPCCPPGNVYVDQDGFFIGNDPMYPGFYGVRHQVSNPAPLTGIASTCANVVNGAWAIPTTNDPVTCPCCQPNQWYNNTAGMCVDLKGVLYDPVPCITCICPDPPPPPPPCETCSAGTLPIHFHFRDDVKHCTNCKKDIGEPDLKPFTGFIADKLIAPIIKFIRR